MIGLPVTLGAIALIALIVIRLSGARVEGATDFGVQEQGHDQDVEYTTEGLPPVGGVHSPMWQTCGIYDQPVEDKNAVHSMEHGAVWITYQPELPAEDVDTLRDLVGDQSYLLLSPYPGLKSAVVLTAWGVQLEVESASDKRIANFIDTYRIGPQTPEFGASCSDGVGVPIG